MGIYEIDALRQMSTKLNGWHRLGIALSVAWALFLLTVALWDTLGDGKTNVAELVAEVVAVTMVTLLVAWLAVYLLVWTVRWIVRGFRRSHGLQHPDQAAASPETAGGLLSKPVVLPGWIVLVSALVVVLSLVLAGAAMVSADGADSQRAKRPGPVFRP